MLEYADRHGIVVIDETPAVGLNTRLGGPMPSGHGVPTFSADTINDATREAHRQAIRRSGEPDHTEPAVAADQPTDVARC